MFEANVYAKYTMGALSVGYAESGYQPAIASGELAYYEGKKWGIQYDVSDAVSLSYNMDKSEKIVRVAVAVGATAGTRTQTDGTRIMANSLHNRWSYDWSCNS